MVLRDRNHASVMTWSVGNELLRGGSAEEAYIREAVAEAKRLDPTRFVGIDKTLAPVRDLPRSYRLLDAIGLSAYLGWYGGSTRDLGPALRQVRRRFPDQALFVTEFGAESTFRGPASRKGSYAFQSRFVDRYLRTIDSSPFVGGAVVWILRDFAVRPGWEGGNPRPRPPFNHKGLIEENGRRKPAFAAARRRFEGVPALGP
jgi:beta-glucuronidase